MSETLEKPADESDAAPDAGAGADNLSAVDAMVPAGLLKLSGSDALGQNPWTREKPVASEFGLTDDDFADGKIEKQQEAARSEMVEYPWRTTSAFLLPVTAFIALYMHQSGDVSFLDPSNVANPASLPPFVWVAYLGASLVLGAMAAHAQTLVNASAVKKSESANKVIRQKQAFASAQADWYNDLKARTTTAFWRDEIQRIAAAKGSTPTAVFSQEVAKLFAAWGWEVKLNQRADDYGVDMFASGKDGSAIVQCKHLDTGPGVQDVRDLAGSRHAFSADFGLLVSIHPPSASRHNGFFSDKG
ncbi:MAG: restriction endonuclease, partial [Alphaproteobacteria bacterium]